MKKINLLIVLFFGLCLAVDSFAFSFNFGNASFVDKTIKKGQKEGKVSTTPEDDGGGGGGGGEEPGPLQISNVEIVSIQKWGVKGERSALVTWQTNKPATSKVEIMDQRIKDLGGVWSSRENQQLVKNHEVEIYWIRPGTTSYFRVTSKTSSEEAQSGELSKIIPAIQPGEIGVFNIFVAYNTDTEWVDLYWYSIEDNSAESYYFVSSDGINWSGQMPANCSYDNITYQCYITHNSYGESAPKGSRRYYKISGQSIIFYVDFPTTYFSGALLPLKP